MRREKNECPACGFKLSGSRFTGFRCVKCHAQYSARYIAQVQRRKAQMLIDQHFGNVSTLSSANTVIEKSDIFIEDHGTITKMIEEIQQQFRQRLTPVKDLEVQEMITDAQITPVVAMIDRHRAASSIKKKPRAVKKRVRR